MLVHCQEGLSRSPSTVVAFLMQHRNMTLQVRLLLDVLVRMMHVCLYAFVSVCVIIIPVGYSPYPFLLLMF